MHILHVIQRFYPFMGGSEIYFQELSEQLAADGHHVTVLTTDAWDLDHFWAPGRRRIDEHETHHRGVRILRFPVERIAGPPIMYPIIRRLMVEFGRVPGTVPLLRRMAQITPRVPGLTRYLRTTTDHYDLVNTTNITLDFTIIPAFCFAHQRGIPHICTPFVHLGEPGSDYIVRYYSQPHQIDLLKRSARVLVQSSLEGRFLSQRGVSSERIVELGGWVRPETLVGGDAARFRAEHSIDEPIVLSIGAAAYDKGTMHAIEAMQQLWRDGSNARLVLIASNLLAQFETYWAQLPATTRERITLLQAVPHQTKLDALAAAQAFVLPSRTDSFGIVFLEAWMYDVPVIGARAGGVPDIIDDGRDGYLVPFGDTIEIARKLATLLDDRERAQQMGQQGHAKVLATMTFERKYRMLIQIYREAIERGT